MSRIGLLGGTFDPPHYGHLIAAQEAAGQLQLEQVLFLPTRQNPLKQAEPSTQAQDRCDMVGLAIADNPLFALSRLDIDRGPPAYTADLLRALHAEQAGTAERELFFLIGADILPELHRWHTPEEVLRLARLVVVNRPGAPSPDLAALALAVPSAHDRILVVRIPGVDTSASDLRARVRTGRSLRYLTPPAVERYIAAKRLYQTG